MRLAAMVWWLILWYASDEGELEIPSEHEWLTCELIATLVEEATEEKFWYSWRHNGSGREHHHQWNEWPNVLNGEMDRCDKYHRTRFDGWNLESRFRKWLKRFVWQSFQSDSGEKGYVSELKLFHIHNTPTSFGYSRFKPHREMYDKASSELFEYSFVGHAEVYE